MSRLLVTGATGFVGRWTLRHWRAAYPDVELWATSNEPTCPEGLADEFAVLDLCQAEAVREFVHACAPTEVIHLAGLIAPAPLADHLAVNVLGTENLYGALADASVGSEVRVVQVGTAAVYGCIAADELPIQESVPLRPLTAYALSKAAQDHLAEMFWRTKGLSVIRARVFNLLGPGQPEHLVPAAFIKQLKSMRDGQRIQVGNLAPRRDFVDVRDVARAFERLLARGTPGAAYNVGSGRSIEIRRVLEKLIALSGLRGISIEQEEICMRAHDVMDVYANVTAIEKAVGWYPQISLEESLHAMFEADGGSQ